MTLRFTKMAGCGNDFILIEGDDVPAGTDLSELGRRLCDRHRGIEAGGAELALDSIDTGVPHAVIWTDDLERAEVERLGRLVRHHPAFPRGTNTNFAQLVPGGLALRTYERGVEAETFACGTGAAA